MFADDKIRVFLSYSHVDRDYADMLTIKKLSLLQEI